MLKNFLKKYKTSLLFGLGMLIYTLSNLLSAATMNIHFDEAYYWLYSKHPALSYFDHPPMVSWLITAGQIISKSVGGLRLFSTLLSSGTIYILWLLSRPYKNKPILFWALIYGIILIHPYSFIATPDAPLFFFTALFFLTYRNYLDKNSLVNSFFLSLSIGLMLYSKYHGILVVGFTLLSNFSQIKKKTFWIVFISTLILLVPQIIWQIQNNFASINYHLFESHNTEYKLTTTLLYIVSQLAITGPWLGFMFLYILFTNRPNTILEKSLKWTGVGIFVFFLIGTLSGDYEAHWTLAALVPLVIISYKYIAPKKKWHKWVYLSGSINLTALIVAKIIIALPISQNISLLSLYNGWDQDSKKISEATNNTPILFQDVWNKAARFEWYNKSDRVFNLNSALYRKNQYSFWNFDENFTGQTVCLLSLDSTQFKNPIIIQTNKKIWYTKTIENYHSYQKLSLEINNQKITADSVHLDVKIQNPYNYEFDPENPLQTSKFLLYRKERDQWFLIGEDQANGKTIKANSEMSFHTKFTLNTSKYKKVYLMLKIGEFKPIPSTQMIKLSSSDKNIPIDAQYSSVLSTNNVK